MKKIILFILIILSSTFTVFAGFQSDGATDVLWMNLNITTYTSEPCGFGEESNTSQLARYKCTLSASTGFIDFISSIYKYIFFITLVIGVLVMVVIGILMAVGWIVPDGEEFKTKAKAKIMDILIGLIALAMIPWILKTIAPFFFT
jgi:hypothetical protein